MHGRNALILCILISAIGSRAIGYAQPARSEGDLARSDGATIGMAAGCTTDSARLNADRRGYLAMLQKQFDTPRAAQLGGVFASGVNVGTRMLSIAQASGSDLHCDRRLSDLEAIEQRLKALERK